MAFAEQDVAVRSIDHAPARLQQPPDLATNVGRVAVGRAGDIHERPFGLAQPRELVDQRPMAEVRIEVGRRAQRCVARNLRGEAIEQPLVGRHLRPAAKLAADDRVAGEDLGRERARSDQCDAQRQRGARPAHRPCLRLEPPQPDHRGEGEVGHQRRGVMQLAGVLHRERAEQVRQQQRQAQEQDLGAEQRQERGRHEQADEIAHAGRLDR